MSGQKPKTMTKNRLNHSVHLRRAVEFGDPFHIRIIIELLEMVEHLDLWPSKSNPIIESKRAEKNLAHF